MDNGLCNVDFSGDKMMGKMHTYFGHISIPQYYPLVGQSIT